MNAEEAVAYAQQQRTPGANFRCHRGCLMLAAWKVPGLGIVVWRPALRVHHPKVEAVRRLEKWNTGEVASDRPQRSGGLAIYLDPSLPPETPFPGRCDHHTYAVAVGTVAQITAGAVEAAETGRKVTVAVPADAPKMDRTRRGKA